MSDQLLIEVPAILDSAFPLVITFFFCFGLYVILRHMREAMNRDVDTVLNLMVVSEKLKNKRKNEEVLSEEESPTYMTIGDDGELVEVDGG